MNIFTEIKLLLSLRSAYKEVKMQGLKSGWKTSEFWLTLLAGAAGIGLQYGGLIPGPWGMLGTAGIISVYTLLRTYYKLTHPSAQLPPDIPMPETPAPVPAPAPAPAATPTP